MKYQVIAALLLGSLLLQHQPAWALRSANARASRRDQDGPIVASTPFGQVSGTADQGVMAFRAIPYAQPPVGALRFAPTQALSGPWSGIIDGSAFSAGCMAQCTPEMFSRPELMCPATTSEDCLYLNVFTPTLNASANLPVIFFIHGGTYVAGSAGVPLFDGSDLARNENVVVVTTNYRLGALGGLYTGTVTGNFQTMDQRLAMAFTQQIIASFGGNPNKVTLSGQSAGAYSVAVHLTTPASWGYFQGAFIMSNPASIPAATPQEATQLGQMVLKALGCPVGGAAELACLRAANASAIVAAQNVKYTGVGNMIINSMVWTPVVDGTTVPHQPQYALATGKFNNVPLFFGTVSNESIGGIYGTNPNPMTPLAYDLALEAFFGIIEGTEAIKTYSPIPPQYANDTRPYLSFVSTDYMFFCPTRSLAGNTFAYVPTYMYLFSKIASWSEWVFGPTMPACATSVCHTADLPFIFNPFKAPMPNNQTIPVGPTPDEMQLILTMQGALANFARGGSPNPLPFNGPYVPTYDPTSTQIVRFDTPVTLEMGHHDRNCDFWNTFGYQRN